MNRLQQKRMVRSSTGGSVDSPVDSDDRHVSIGLTTRGPHLPSVWRRSQVATESPSDGRRPQARNRGGRDSRGRRGLHHAPVRWSVDGPRYPYFDGVDSTVRGSSLPKAISGMTAASRQDRGRSQRSARTQPSPGRPTRPRWATPQQMASAETASGSTPRTAT